MSKKSEKDILASEFTLDRFEEGKAVLLSSGKECLIPLEYLPRGLKEGDTVQATFSTDEADKKNRAMKAKELLNEILNI